MKQIEMPRQVKGILEYNKRIDLKEKAYPIIEFGSVS